MSAPTRATRAFQALALALAIGGLVFAVGRTLDEPRPTPTATRQAAPAPAVVVRDAGPADGATDAGSPDAARDGGADASEIDRLLRAPGMLESSKSGIVLPGLELPGRE